MLNHLIGGNRFASALYLSLSPFPFPLSLFPLSCLRLSSPSLSRKGVTALTTANFQLHLDLGDRHVEISANYLRGNIAVKTKHGL